MRQDLRIGFNFILKNKGKTSYTPKFIEEMECLPLRIVHYWPKATNVIEVLFQIILYKGMVLQGNKYKISLRLYKGMQMGL